jgi:hypothetical protein
MSATTLGTALERLCNRLAHAALPTDYALLENAGLLSGHPWAHLADAALADPGGVAYYRYLYGFARVLDPEHILEIGTGFGLGAAAFIQGAPRLRRLTSLDLGIFAREHEIVAAGDSDWAALGEYRDRTLEADGRNIALARRALDNLVRRLGRPTEVALWQVNTQPSATDNFGVLSDVARWFELPELVTTLEDHPVDLLFIDGKHTEDGLYQDFRSFFPYVRPGGVVLCDDLHDSSFDYPWAGQTVASFERARREFADAIDDVYVWPFPQVVDWFGQEPALRPMGLVRKKAGGEAG